MAQHGSPLFEAYTRNLRRLYWSEFIDRQMDASRNSTFKASIVNDPITDADSLAPAYDYHRHRTFTPNSE